MATVMTPAQIRRLHEISHQIWGIEALASDLELQNALNLSEIHRENIKAAHAYYAEQTSKMSLERSDLKNAYEQILERRPTREEEREFRIKNADLFESHGERERELAAAFIREINRQLTKRQREAFEKAKGKPFDFDGMTAPGSRERNEQKEAERSARLRRTVEEPLHRRLRLG